MGSILGRNFYSRHPRSVAHDIIGKTLVRRLDDGQILKGIIVEAEAYGGNRDPASHAFRGVTQRNAVMFGEAGHAYVYFTYGFHNCLNFVTGEKGVASAVLIRALEPKEGIEMMIRLRKTGELTHLTNGPGKLCQALSIDRSLNGIDVTSRESKIHVINGGLEMKVISAIRIGIKTGKEKKWRFFAKSSQYVSHR
jgi:DNA-3-methyladenine glycosylase